MRIDGRCGGQAAVEFAMGLFIFVLILSALVGFAPLFLRNTELQSDARCDAGLAALNASEGSDDLGGVAAITARAQPRRTDEADVDPWNYPIRRLPDEARFPAWRGNSLSAGGTVPGSRKKDFRFRLSVGGQLLVDDVGWLSEEVYLPAMGRPRTAGGGL